MGYIDFRDSIERELRSNPQGLTWAELKERLDLPYSAPCYTWMARLEREIGLTRTRSGRRMVWRVNTAVVR